MAQSLNQFDLHVVFSTQGRRPFRQDPKCCTGLYERLVKISNELGCPSLEAGGVADHAHVLARLSKALSVSDYGTELKRATSAWGKAVFASTEIFYQ
ncbi:MAG: transposase [Planctomycetes bacterium]|nr:transposase [Planctomycetota bacterium]